jgi:hypothetical protein
MSDDLVVIHTARNNAEADFIKGVLEGEGIQVSVEGYNRYGMLINPAGSADLNIMGPECDAERAKQYIAQVEISETEKENP